MSITTPQRLLNRALLIAILALLLAGPGRALAHGGHTGPMQTFTQQFGPYEIAIGRCDHALPGRPARPIV
jgi:hypothetical protein